MPKVPDDNSPDYPVYRSGRSTGASSRPATPAGRAGVGGAGRAGAGAGGRDAGSRDRPYKTYRSGSRSLRSRLRGESDADIGQREALADPPRSRFGRRAPGARRGWTAGRVLKYVVLLAVAWVAFSAVLFFVSAQEHSGDLPAGATAQLTSGGPMLVSANTVLILGLDNRPTTGVDSKEGGGANTKEKDANTDTIMLWRIGGGVSRRLSIPRDTLVNIPGLGESKINAAWAYGGPGLALKVIKQFTGLQINHLIVVDLGNFPKFIDDIGGVTVKTPKICSNISGGVKLGGFTLDLNPGTHHLDGENAMILARTRDNSCDPAYNDINREAMQQEILNGIKSQLFSLHAFIHLPWAAWDAPGVVQTDMGGLSLMQLFISSEIGGSAPSGLLKETPETTANGADVLVPNAANVRAAVQKLMNG